MEQAVELDLIMGELESEMPEVEAGAWGTCLRIYCL